MRLLRNFRKLHKNRWQCATHWVVLILLVAAGRSVQGQSDSGAGQEEANLETMVFSVADLVLPAPDYSFQGIDLPGLPGDNSAYRSGSGQTIHGLGGLGGGGFGGGGGGSGGGFFQVDPNQGGMGLGGMGGLQQPQPGQLSTPRRFGMDDLIEVILKTVQPESWEDVGGPGSIATLGTMLVIRQQPAVLAEIDRLLQAIRHTGGTLQSVTVRVDWLLLEPQQVSELLLDSDSLAPSINRNAVRALAATSGASGQITCFDGQTVHIVAGHLRSGVSSVIPVVGQVGPENSPATLPRSVLAQQFTTEDSTSNRWQVRAGGGGIGGGMPVAASSSVGYQPVMKATNLGALLQVTPSVAVDRNGAVLDLRSLVVRQAGRPQQQVDFHNVVPLDQLNVVVQQFMTTLHLPLDEPRLVAGSTLEPFSQDTAGKQLFLVVEVGLGGRSSQITNESRGE